MTPGSTHSSSAHAPSSACDHLRAITDWNMCGPARPDPSLSPLGPHGQPRPSHGPALPTARPFPRPGPSHGPALPTALPFTRPCPLHGPARPNLLPLPAWPTRPGARPGLISCRPRFVLPGPPPARFRQRNHPGPASTHLHLTCALCARTMHPASRTVAALQHFGHESPLTRANKSTAGHHRRHNRYDLGWWRPVLARALGSDFRARLAWRLYKDLCVSLSPNARAA